MLEVEFSGELWSWRGPAPWYFVSVPEEECSLLRDASEFVSYGWGMIPATIRIGSTQWDTSLFPEGEGYVVPVKAAVRRAEQLDEGDRATVHVRVRVDG